MSTTNRAEGARDKPEGGKESASGLDEIDYVLLDLLQQDSSQSVSDLAEATHLSPSPCWRRVNKLKEDGYIRRQVAILDNALLDLSTIVFVSIKLSAQARPKLMEFANTIRLIPEVLECYVTLGGSDFLLKVVTKDIKSYESFFFSRLSTIPDIEEIHSTIAMSEIKVTTELPIPHHAERPTRDLKPTSPANSK